jgi:hypothetical protein
MINYVNFHMLNGEQKIEFTIQIPANMVASDVANLLAPHMGKCIVTNVTTVETPDDETLEECMSIVFDSTNPGEGLTEDDAARIIAKLKSEDWEIPDMLTPSLFIELYNDLEPLDEDEDND